MHDANGNNLMHGIFLWMKLCLKAWLSVACFIILNVVFVHEEMYQICLFWSHVHCTMKVSVDQGNREMIFLFLINAWILKRYFIYLNTVVIIIVNVHVGTFLPQKWQIMFKMYSCLKCTVEPFLSVWLK